MPAAALRPERTAAAGVRLRSPRRRAWCGSAVAVVDNARLPVFQPFGHLFPSQLGAKKFLAQYGDRLVCVRYGPMHRKGNA